MHHADEGCDEGEDAEEGDRVEPELGATREVVGVGVGEVLRRQLRLREVVFVVDRHVGAHCGRRQYSSI